MTTNQKVTTFLALPAAVLSVAGIAFWILASAFVSRPEFQVARDTLYNRTSRLEVSQSATNAAEASTRTLLVCYIQAKAARGDGLSCIK